MLWLLIVAAVVVFVFWLTRQGELFCLSVRSGKVLLVRGRVPGGLLGDFRDHVAARPAVRRGTIRAMRGDLGAELHIWGIDEGRCQRLRNIFGLFPMSRLRAAPRDENRTFGQLMGIAWLAWLLDRGR
jgi:hypothetical protein